MIDVIAVILAAGRGSRMNSLTDAKPKCLLPLAGKPLLHWQVDALRAAGLEKIVVVRGYKGELLAGDFDTIDNPRWASTNMVQSLLCAFERFPERRILVSYSDIVYRAAHVRGLLACNADIAISYDAAWLDLWRLRNENPLEDAETFHEENGKLLEIGNKPKSLDEVQGQYMGLLHFSPAGTLRVREHVRGIPAEIADRLDMTSLLQGLLRAGTPIGAVPVRGGWCECDTEKDIQCYEQALVTGGWLHDWRAD